ncbi:MAG: hypothetical protein JHC54_05725 [Acinetobacter sp.]|nr:hypothetical protein [Acinetobacter sp.]
MPTQSQTFNKQKFDFYYDRFQHFNAIGYEDADQLHDDAYQYAETMMIKTKYVGCVVENPVTGERVPCREPLIHSEEWFFVDDSTPIVAVDVPKIKQTSRERNSQIRKICSDHNWPIWETYNHKRKDGSIRIKFRRNGAKATDKTQSRIQRKVSAYLRSVDINALSVYWKVCYAPGRGNYDAFIVEYKPL